MDTKLLKQLLKHLDANIADLIDSTTSVLPTDMPYIMGRIYELTNMKYFIVASIQANKDNTKVEEDMEESL